MIIKERGTVLSVKNKSLLFPRFAVLAGADAGLSAEHAAEVVGIGKSDALRAFSGGHADIGKQRFRAFDTDDREILSGRISGRLFENVVEAVAAHIAERRGVIEVDVRIRVDMDIVQRLADFV